MDAGQLQRGATMSPQAVPLRVRVILSVPNSGLKLGSSLRRCVETLAEIVSPLPVP
jgi:hypothetical protein